MSTANIVQIVPRLPAACYVVFQTHGKESTRTYAYYGSDAVAVAAGADPAGFAGERVDSIPEDIGGEIAGEIGEDIADAVLDIGEIGLL